MLNKRAPVSWLIGICMLMMAGPLFAQTSFGAANGQSAGVALSSLYTIDPANGNATLVGPIGFNNVTGMAFLPDGRLVASANGDDETGGGPAALLIEINRLTGAGALIGIIHNLGGGDNCGRMPDISYDDTTGTLFGYADFCNAGFEGLYSINPDTGAGTSIGPSGYSGGGNGMDAQPGTGALFATPFDTGSLVSINPVTGAGTDVPGSVGNVPFRINSLDFHPVSGVLYGTFNDAGTSTNKLVTIDINDGTTTTIGESTTGLDAIAFETSGFAPSVPIPTLNGYWLIMLGLLLALSSRKFLRHRV